MTSLATVERPDRLPTIDTPRLRIRWLKPADVPALFAIFGDPEICRYWSHPAFTDISAATALQQQIEQYFRDGVLYQWGVAERATDEVIGTCTLAWISQEHSRAEIGFALARRAWGHGYMREVVPAMLAHAFETMGLHRVEADVEPRNTRSIRVLEDAGFQREGFLRERYHLLGEWQDAVLYGLLRSDWLARKGAP